MACFTFGQRQAASTILGWPASPSLPKAKTLILGATTIVLGPLSFKHGEAQTWEALMGCTILNRAREIDRKSYIRFTISIVIKRTALYI